MWNVADGNYFPIYIPPVCRLCWENSLRRGNLGRSISPRQRSDDVVAGSSPSSYRVVKCMCVSSGFRSKWSPIFMVSAPKTLTSHLEGIAPNSWPKFKIIGKYYWNFFVKYIKSSAGDSFRSSQLISLGRLPGIFQISRNAFRVPLGILIFPGKNNQQLHRKHRKLFKQYCQNFF